MTVHGAAPCKKLKPVCKSPPVWPPQKRRPCQASRSSIALKIALCTPILSTDQSGATVIKGVNNYMAIRAAATKAIQPFDYVLSPVSPVPTFPAEWETPTNDVNRPLEHIAFTMPYNMSEQPAASINCGYTKDGKPIGLQIAGHRFDDGGVMRLSRWYEAARGAQKKWPEPPST